MNRFYFLKSILSLLAVITPATVFSAHKSQQKVQHGLRVSAGKDRFGKPIFPFEGDTFHTKVSGKDTNGELYIFESTRLLKGGPPLHYHYEQDEWWYILEGEFLFKVGDETFTAKTGESIFGPRMIPHAFAKINEGTGKLLMAFQPAGRMEEHFNALSEGLTLKLTEEEKHKFRQKNGFEVVGPPLIVEKSNRNR